jgi:hypothetical protein
LIVRKTGVQDINGDCNFRSEGKPWVKNTAKEGGNALESH